MEVFTSNRWVDDNNKIHNSELSQYYPSVSVTREIKKNRYGPDSICDYSLDWLLVHELNIRSFNGEFNIPFCIHFGCEGEDDNLRFFPVEDTVYMKTKYQKVDSYNDIEKELRNRLASKMFLRATLNGTNPKFKSYSIMYKFGDYVDNQGIDCGEMLIHFESDYFISDVCIHSEYRLVNETNKRFPFDINHWETNYYVTVVNKKTNEATKYYLRDDDERDRFGDLHSRIQRFRAERGRE